MELDELKELWRETDRRLQALGPALSLNLRLARSGTLDRTRSQLRRVRLVLRYEVLFAILAVLLMGSYLFDHLGTARFALPATALQLGALLTLGLAARQLVALARIDYAGPVVAIQRRLAELSVARASSNRWLLLSSPLVWSLLVVVAPHGLFGLDVYRSFGWPWLAANFVFGIAILGAAMWASRRFPATSRVAAFLRRLGDDLTGRRLALASGVLNDIVAFEGEG